MRVEISGLRTASAFMLEALETLYLICSKNISVFKESFNKRHSQ